jgi:DNA-binding PadR family transcriptional regulator
MAETAHPSPEQMLPLTPAVFHIQLALAGEPKHGYGIMKTVEEITGGKVAMGPGTLYGTIKRMLKAGLIEEIDEQPAPDLDDERRRYYRLTPFGRRVLKAEVERIAGLMRVARSKGLLGEAA